MRTMEEISSGVCAGGNEKQHARVSWVVFLLKIWRDQRSRKGTHEFLLLSLELYLDDRLATLVDDLERPVLHISLDLGVIEFTTDKTLGVEDGVVWVHGDL